MSKQNQKTILCTKHALINARTRVLMKNMAYVGAVAALTGIDVAVIGGLVEEMFGTKAHLIEANMKAIQLGLEYDPHPPVDAGSPHKAPAAIVKLVNRRFEPRLEAFDTALKEALAQG